jgi:hypothetical protein
MTRALFGRMDFSGNPAELPALSVGKERKGAEVI